MKGEQLLNENTEISSKFEPVFNFFLLFCDF